MNFFVDLLSYAPILSSFIAFKEGLQIVLVQHAMICGKLTKGGTSE
jgi:hypothetical protein